MRRRLRAQFDQLLGALRPAVDVCIAHEFHKPPWGGGNQFCLALAAALELRGKSVRRGLRAGEARACLFNSHTFDAAHLRRLRARGQFGRLVHRVDGPIGRVRGTDDHIDREILAINQELAAATVFQSRYSLNAHLEQGMRFVQPVVIPNAVDGRIFFPRAPGTRSGSDKVRILSSSWSSNLNKGAGVVQQIESLLDWERFEWRFVGNAPLDFKHIEQLPPVPSKALADELRAADLYLIASKNEPCSNALLEALACGLPVVYLNSGSHGELVGDAGEAFNTPAEAVHAIEQVAAELSRYRDAIVVTPMDQIAERYEEVLLP